MTTLHLNDTRPDARRRERLFAGDFFVFASRPSVAALCSHAQGMIAATFPGQDPETAQYRMSVGDFVSAVGPMKSRFTNDLHTKELVRGILSEFGHDLGQTYFDVPRLRVVTSDQFLTAGVGYAYKAHRDTWYSSPECQVNWWLPVYDLESERTLAFYPSYWSRPIRNSSHGFDYDEWVRVGRAAATKEVGTDTRKHPLPTEPIDEAAEMRMVFRSAESVLFSASHLHATVPNTSGKTRFSLDFRTVHLDDLASGAASPNIDNASIGTTLGDFIRASDFSPIPRECVEAARKPTVR
jgi:hypothetical protein